MQRQLSHRTNYREIAAYFKPRLGPLQPGVAILTTPEYPEFGFYLFRQGEYWDTFYFHKSDERFRDELERKDHLFYVVDPSGTLYGGKVKPEWEALLAQNTRDITDRGRAGNGHKDPAACAGAFDPTSTVNRTAGVARW